jgi:radical SAM protein with 4Fe4S-binding SPASM domain
MGLGFVCELTPRCSLDCAFCYNVWKDAPASMPAELPAASWEKILDSILDAATPEWIAFAGGEPLASPDLPRIVRHVHDRSPRTRIGVASNGLSLTREVLDGLIEAGLSHVELPLFTLDAGRYERLTGHDCPDQVKRAITAVTESAASLTIAVTLLPDERDDLDIVLRYAHALGADRIALNRFVPTGRGAVWDARLDDVGREAVLDDQLVRADAFAAARDLMLDVTIPVEDCLHPHDRFPNLRFHPCVCGETKWVIDPSGRLRTCEQNRDVLGDLTARPPAELLGSADVAEFSRRTLKPECPECARWSVCRGGCRFTHARVRFRRMGATPT